MRLGCLLSLFMPYELANWMLSQWSGFSLSASMLWNWVQLMGSKAQQEIEAQLETQSSGTQMACESISKILAALPLAIFADEVMVPFRPTSKTTKRKVHWREVKVTILARLGKRVSRDKKIIPQLLRRRLVAVLD